MDSEIEKFVNRQNLKRFRALIFQAASEEERAPLRRLLAEEEARSSEIWNRPK